MGLISTVVDAMGNKSTITRDLMGRPLTVTKPDQTVTAMTYDPVTGDLLKTVDGGTGIFESKTYDMYGNVLTQTTGDVNNAYAAKTVVNTYDATTGLLLQTQYPAGNVVAYQYNSKGLVTSKIVQNGSVNILTTFGYDSYGNVVQTTTNDGVTTVATFDPAGNQVSTISTSNGTDTLTTVYVVDSFNRLVSVNSPKKEVTSYSYLPTGELAKIVDPKNNQTVFQYDVNGRLISKTDPSNFSYSFVYDKNGNRIQETDPNGNIKRFNYDPLNRLVQANFPDDVVSYQFDLRGNVVLASNNVSQIATTVDTKGRTIFAQASGLGAMVNYPSVGFNYSFDDAGNRIQLKTSSGALVSYGFDANNRMTALSSISGSFGFGYDGAGHLTGISRPGGNSVFSFTGAGMLSSIQHNEVNGSDFENLTYDQRYFPTSKRTPTGQYNYAFDGNGQLLTASNPNAGVTSEGFSYDSLGNRMADGLGNSYQYDSASQRLTDDGNYSYQYDNNGNVLRKLAHDSTKESFAFTYNSKNQLIQTQVFVGVLTGVTRQINYFYDVVGRRMQKAVLDNSAPADPKKSFTRNYVYDGQNIFYEADGGGVVLAQYTHTPNVMDDVLAANITGAGVTAGLAQSAGNYYYLKDHLGSITSVADSLGNIVQRYDYRSFGKIISIRNAVGVDVSASPVVNTSFTFTGREWDSESGLFYCRARFYDPSTGRFLQSDPHPGNVMSPIGLINKYIYAANNPLIFTDPTGQDNFWNGLGQALSVVAGAVAAFYGGAAIAALLGLAGTAGAIVGGLTGAFIGGAVTAGGFALSHGDPMTGFEIGVGVGLFAGAAGGYLGNAALNLTPYQVTSGQVFNAFKNQTASAVGNAFAGGSQLINAGAAASGIGSAPVWGYFASLANAALPYVVGAADIVGTVYTHNCIQSGTCSSVLPQNPSASGSWSF